MSLKPDPALFETEAEKILKEVFSSHVKRLRKGPGDFVAKARNKQLIVEVKASQSPRISELEGKLVLALLQLLRHSVKEEECVVMIGFPKVGPKILGHTKAFMANYAPQAGWCLFDLSGTYHFEMYSQGIAKSVAAFKEHRHALPTSPGSLFSDLNCWMLKILLMHDVSPTYWGGPAVQIRSPSELCTIAKVSSEKAYSFLRALRASGFIQEDHSAIKIIRRQELLRTWMRHQVTYPQRFVPVRSPFGPITTLGDVLTPRGTQSTLS